LRRCLGNGGGRGHTGGDGREEEGKVESRGEEKREKRREERKSIEPKRL